MTLPLAVIKSLEFTYTDGSGNATDRRPLISIDTLTIYPGEITVIIGDNGSGKTTLLKILNGLLKPSSGGVEFTPAESSGRLAGNPAGRFPILPSHSSFLREKTVLVHQTPYIFSETVFDNVAYPLRIRRVPRHSVQERVFSAIEKVGLSGLTSRWAPSLSGGEKQRLAVARGMVLNPSLLILDEPTSNVDYLSVRTIETVLREEARNGVSVVMTTHNLASAYRIGTRIIPLECGRIRPLEVNVLRGRSSTCESDHIGRFEVENNGPVLYCPAINREHHTAVIRMDDIILSREQTHTSAQNHLSGRIISVVSHENELFMVTIDCGCSICGVVTQPSVESLGLSAGENVFVTFKASAVHLY